MDVPETGSTPSDFAFYCQHEPVFSAYVPLKVRPNEFEPESQTQVAAPGKDRADALHSDFCEHLRQFDALVSGCTVRAGE